MQKFLTAAIILICMTGQAGYAQFSTGPLLKIYRASAPKTNDLVHTRIDVRFDYKKCYLYGKEWITLKPHFYPTDTLRLDAKGMDINRVAIVTAIGNNRLKFTYDGRTLTVGLDRTYKGA